MKKRIFAILITIVMAVQSLTAFASMDFENSDSAAVRFVVALGFMSVDEYSNRFWDDVPVTRIEFAKIICKMNNLTPAEEPQTVLFDDVNADERKYAETVARYGYMSGYGDGRFGPDDYLTKSQLLTVIVKIMGGEAFAQAAGGYPIGYIEAGQRLGLKSRNLAATENIAKQIDVANIIYDAMHSEIFDVVGITSNGGVQYATKEGYTFLSEKLNIYKHEGIMLADEVTGLDQAGGVGDNAVRIGDQVFYDTNHLSDGFLGNSVIVYEKKTEDDYYGEIIYIEPTKDNNVIFIDGTTYEFGAIEDRRVIYYDDNRTRDISLDYAVSMIYNGVAEDFDSSKITAQCEEIYFIDNDDDRLYEVVSVYDYEDCVITSTRPEEQEILLDYNVKKIALEDVYSRIYSDDYEIGISELKAGDVISVALSRNTSGDKLYTIRLGNGNISGSITGMYMSDEYTEVVIDEKEYRLSSTAKNLISEGQLVEPRSGDSGVFRLNARNEIVAWDLTAEEEVAYLCGYGRVEKNFEDALQIAIFTQRGELKKISSSEKIRINGTRMKIEEIFNNPDIVENLSTRQLIKVLYKEDVIKEITFPEESYDKLEFSKDSALVSRKCTRNSILEEKFAITDKTIVFRVPLMSYDNLSGQGTVSLDESDYTILKKGFVSQGASVYAELYDIQPSGDISYILAPYVVGETFIKENSSLLLVSNSGAALNDYEDVVQYVKGYGDDGKEIKLYSKYDYSMVDSKLNRTPECGDVIQYVTNGLGEVIDISIVCSIDDDEDDYTVSSIIGTTDIDFLKIFGRAGYASSSRVGVYTGAIPDNPLEMDAIVNDSGSAVFRVEGRFVEPIQFSDIDVHDEIFAVKNRSDQTKMFVVYK